MALFKALKHKVLEDSYGWIMDDTIYTSMTPRLQPIGADLAHMKEYFEAHDGSPLSKALENYDLVTLEVTLKQES